MLDMYDDTIVLRGEEVGLWRRKTKDFHSSAAQFLRFQDISNAARSAQRTADAQKPHCDATPASRGRIWPGFLTCACLKWGRGVLEGKWRQKISDPR
eukprot:scaffold2908_cov257-Pinguiococcus_pyrenoidosus.AAC.34